MKRRGIGANRKKALLFSALTALAVGLMVGAIYILQHIAPFGEGSVLSHDAIAQYNPILTELIGRLKEGGSLLFSWQSGFGVNFFCTMLYYLINPFNLLGLLFSAANMQIAFALIIMLNLMFIGFTAALYFQKRMGAHLPAMFCAVSYVFCGFIVGCYYNTMWLMSFAMLPLIALGIERIAKGKSGLLYCLSLFVAIFCNFYLGFMLCIFSVLYFFVCLFSNPLNRKNEVRAKKEKLLPVMAKFGVFSLIAGGLSGISIIPVMNTLGQAYIKNPFAFKGNFFFNFGQFLEMHLSGVLPANMLVTQKTLPQVAVCSVVLVLLSLYWFAKKIPLNKKIAYTALIVLLWASFELPALYYVWHGMSSPAGLPYRFAFIYSFVLIVMAADVFTNLKSIPKWAFAIPPILLGTLYVCAFLNIPQFKQNLIGGAVFCTVLFVLIVWARFTKRAVKVLTIVLTLVVFTELVTLNYRYISPVQSTENFAIYRQDVAETQAQIEKTDTGFYRMEFNYPAWTLLKSDSMQQEYGMTPSLYSYNGVSQFSSLTNWNFALMQYSLGNYGNTGNAYGYSMQTPIYNSLFGVKYIMDNVRVIQEDNLYYRAAAQTENFKTYLNTNYLGLGVVADVTLTDFQPLNANPFITQTSLWQAATGVGGVFNVLQPANVQYNGCHSVSMADAKQQDETVVEDDGENEEHDHDHVGEEGSSVYDLLDAMGGTYLYKIDDRDGFSITFSVEIEKTEEVYLSFNGGALDVVTISSVGDEDLTIYVPERSLVSLGQRTAGETVNITLTGKDYSKNYITDQVYDDAVYFSLATLNDEKYRQGIEALNANGTVDLDVTEDTRVSGTINAAQDGIVMLSMMRDEGWTVWVDGQETELMDHQSHILMFAVSQGEHTIEMRYMPAGLKEGAFVSVAALFILLLAVLLLRVRKNRAPEFDGPEENPDASYVRKAEDFSPAPDSAQADIPKSEE